MKILTSSPVVPGSAVVDFGSVDSGFNGCPFALKPFSSFKAASAWIFGRETTATLENKGHITIQTCIYLSEVFNSYKNQCTRTFLLTHLKSFPIFVIITSEGQYFLNHSITSRWKRQEIYGKPLLPLGGHKSAVQS